ncbi:MAG: hypothetical protein ACK5C8_02195 [Roseiflexaceae bacterium]|jgi:hypothetical protein|nr:hypothetical protein [Chloroflexaceae bacterium]MCE2854020.1 hypothetical protein [Chloroflexaceae bacterium]
MDTLWQLWQTVVIWAGMVWAWLLMAWGWITSLNVTMPTSGDALVVGFLAGWNWLMTNTATQADFLANLVTILAPILAYLYRGFLADILIRFDNQEQKRALSRFLELTTASINASNARLLADAQKNQKALVEDIHNNRYVFKSRVFDTLYKEWQQANNELRNNIKYIESKRFDKVSTTKLKDFQAHIEGMLKSM